MKSDEKSSPCHIDSFKDCLAEKGLTSLGMKSAKGFRQLQNPLDETQSPFFPVFIQHLKYFCENLSRLSVHYAFLIQGGENHHITQATRNALYVLKRQKTIHLQDCDYLSENLKCNDF